MSTATAVDRCTVVVIGVVVDCSIYVAGFFVLDFVFIIVGVVGFYIATEGGVCVGTKCDHV